MNIFTELHYSHRSNWLRAAVLGANDGIVSTASLLLGMAAAAASHDTAMVAGLAGLVAGAMSMASGEYVSVSSQADTEQADLLREQFELDNNPEFERQELAAIYHKRGLDKVLALQVADQLMSADALGAHARDELGLSSTHKAQPIQAALASAGMFALGAALPLLIASFTTLADFLLAVGGGSLLTLAALGALAARAGGASLARGAFRVTFWGALAMAATMAVGSLFGTVA